MTDGPVAISLFSGAGGLDLGVEAAGYKRPFAFPDEFDLVGTRASIQAQLGNAVPPLLGQRVAEQVISATRF
jgi:DNA (cytosine-5)-methyltransferase 1